MIFGQKIALQFPGIRSLTKKKRLTASKKGKILKSKTNKNRQIETSWNARWTRY
jgi:hypothetical protein